MDREELLPAILAGAIAIGALLAFILLPIACNDEAEAQPPCNVEETCATFTDGECVQAQLEITLPDGTEFVCLQNERGADWYCWSDNGPQG